MSEENYDSESVDSEDCLRDMLGGLSPDDMPASAWETPEMDVASVTSSSSSNCQAKQSASASNRSESLRTVARDRAEFPSNTATLNYRLLDDEECNADSVFSYAYTCSGYCTPNGKVDRPPLQVVDMGERGHGLLATRRIRKGEVIFTEKAFLATQVLPYGTDDETRSSTSSIEYGVRACQNCFRSMEPVTKCARSPQPECREGSQHEALELPLPHLWPVLPFDTNSAAALADTSNDSAKFKHVSDKCGRVRCTECSSWFCSKSCRLEFSESLGDCCTVHQASLFVRPYQEAAISWASRMFQYDLQRLRKGSRNFSPAAGLCGDKDDLNKLDIGEATVLYGKHERTLRPIYEKMEALLELSPKEKEILSLDHFENLTSKAARNGIAIRTQSPFKSYHAALLRNSGGRGSEKHSRYLQEIARLLSIKNGEEKEDKGAPKLTRDMDRQLDELVAPELAAVFLLTARLNHSCDPNAQVISQEFVDAHIDVVAVRDIGSGEEVTISYIPTNSGASTARRRRELEAKYLFTCTCPKCS